MRAAVLFLAVALCGCPLVPVLVVTPDGGPRPTTTLRGPQVAFYIAPEHVDSTLVEIGVRGDGFDRLSITLASGERRDVRPSHQGVRLHDEILVVQSRRGREDVPLADVDRFVVRDRRSAFGTLGLTAAMTFSGAAIGSLIGWTPERTGWSGLQRGATIGAGIGGAVGALAATTDRYRYDVHVTGF